jgi:beta-phosphoglucomutase-like phosphatase (HAD superfamily)
MSDFKQTVIFDFDGVIHSYISRWQGATVIPDPPVEGIKEAIANIRKKYKVVIVSSRCYQEGGIKAIKKYLDKHGIEVDDVTGEKPAAIVTIDDRGITFDGNPSTLLEKIDNFIPWNKK